MDFVDAALGKGGHEGVERDSARGVRQRHDIGAGVEEGPWRSRIPGGRDEDAPWRREHPCRRRGAEPRVGDHAHRRRETLGVFHACVEPRIVGEQRPDAGQHRSRLRAEPVHVGARRFAGDPPALARRGGGASVERRGELAAHPWPAAFDAGDEAAKERARLRFEQSRLHLDPGRGELRESPARDLRIRIAHRRDHLCDPRLDEGPRARPGASSVAARLQGDVDGGPGGIAAGRGEGMDLGVRLARVPVPPFADDAFAVCDHAADPGVGIGGVQAAASEIERARHVPAVDGAVSVGVHRRSVVRNQRYLAAPRLRRRFVLEALDLVAELAHVREAAVDRGEADIGDLVEIA